jgi:hypothetical protein
MVLKWSFCPRLNAFEEDAMRQRFHHDRTNQKHRMVSDQLHPVVYLALIGAAVGFALAAWGFGADPYADYLLVIVSGFILVAVGIPAILARVGRKHGARGRETSETFRDWATGDLDTGQDRVRGANAAIEILLPLSAVVIGMLAIAVVFYLTWHANA